jgi:Phenylalanyl-tRNA synthetase beta subunit
VRYADLKQTAFKKEKKLLQAVNLFDVYQGKNLPGGKKSYALSFILQDPEKTLVDTQVERTMANILAGLEKEHGAELR